ncbi:MAG: coenzyme F420-0:L-glutamate ligase [Rhodoglobus sp.]
MGAEANPGKVLTSEVDGVVYERIPIKTRLVGPDDDIVAVVTEYATSAIREGDLLFVTEKIVAITQGRSYPIDEIVVRPLARKLSTYVVKTPYGIGLGMPETMEMAFRECGTPRILFAAAVAAVTKKFGRSGDFYRIAGPKARGIDGPTNGTIPPYDSEVVLAPSQPRQVAQQLKAALSNRVDVLIVDINDIGGNILGSTLTKADDNRAVKILSDNPLGQGTQSTPMGIIRRVA